MLFNNDESIFYKGYRQQLLATLTVNIITFSHGFAVGWVAPTLLRLRSDDSYMTIHISVEEASWVGALIGIGAMIGNPIYGYLLDNIGRKLTMYLLPIPHICSWVVVLFTTNIYHLYVARTLTGLTGGGVYLAIPIYVSEIADCKIRGTLGSIFMFSINSGILTGYIIASNMQFYVIPCVIVALPILYLLLWRKFPETPQYYLYNSFYEEAEDSMKFYKNFDNNVDSTIFHSEFLSQRTSIEANRNQQIGLLEELTKKRSIKALMVGVILIFVNVGSGTFTILNYLSMIFAEAEEETNHGLKIIQLSPIFLQPRVKFHPQARIFSPDKIDPNTNSIITGVVQIVGSLCASILVDKCGRKILLLVSSAGMCLGMTIIGLYAYIVYNTSMTGKTWLPLVMLSFVIFIANIGIVTVTFVALVEILPPRIRSFGTTFCMFLLYFFSFLLLKTFPILMEAFKLPGVMWMCAAVAGFGFIFIFICMRETKGMRLEDDKKYY